MKKLNAIFNAIENVIINLCAILLIGIIAIIAYQVVARAADISTSGTEELARYCYVMFVFLLWPVAAKRGQDLRITVLSDLLPQRPRTLLMGVFQIFMAGFGCLFCYSIIMNIQQSMKNNMVLPSNTWLPLAAIQIVVLVGLAMTVIANLLRAVQLFTGEAVIYTQTEENEMIMAEEAAKVAAELASEGGAKK